MNYWLRATNTALFGPPDFAMQVRRCSVFSNQKPTEPLSRLQTNARSSRKDESGDTVL
jgi:hypothetical protein